MTKLFVGACAMVVFGQMLAPHAAQAQTTDPVYSTIFKPAPDRLRGVLSANGKGYLVEPPSEITGPGVREVFAYPDGDRVVVLRVAYRPVPELLIGPNSTRPIMAQTAPGEASVVFWNAATRKTTTLWRQRIEPNDQIWFQVQGSLPSANRVTENDRAIVQYSVTKPDNPNHWAAKTILVVDADRATVRQINFSADDDAETKISRTVPFAALTDTKNATRGQLRFLRADGSLTAPLVQPGPIDWEGWKNNATVFRGVQTISSPSDPNVKSYRWFDANPKTGTLTRIPPPAKTREPDGEPPPPETLPDLILTKRSPKPQSETQVTSVWLQIKSETQSGAVKKEPEAVLVSAEGEPVFLLPRAALYLMNGALYAAPIQTVNAATLGEIQKKRLRDVVINNARQIGVAFTLYCHYNDEKFPVSATGLSGAIGQYMKDPTLLNGFVYSPPTPLTQAGMENVDQVVLGYLPGDGGKAIVYADGHVKWQDNP